MKYLWSSWRSSYIESAKPQRCIFCDKSKEDTDEANFIIHRGKKNFVMLNRYPYNPGHLMVIPYAHIGALEELSSDEREEHYKIVSDVINILKEVWKPQGFNIGMNIGKVGGAGVEYHIHTHIVPRWEGDTNFMSVIADTRVIAAALVDTYTKLKPSFQLLEKHREK